MSALHDIVTKDSTDRSVTVSIADSSTFLPETGVVFNTSGIDLWYRREGAAKVSITEASLSALTDAHADGGFLHIGDGVYRLDLPDAAFAAGANYVDFGGTVTDMIVTGGRVRLVNYSLEDGVRMGLTALPNAAADAAGGLPISDAGGLDLDDLYTTADTAATQTSPTALRGAVGLAAGNLDTQLGDIPTVSEFNARTLVAADYFDPAADTVANVTTVATLTGHTAQTGDSFARLGAPAGASIAADIAAVSVGTTVPVLMTAVPKNRTWKLKKTNAGLVGEDSLAIQVGEAKVLAVDFANDLATNGLLTGITSVAIKSGISGGVTFDTDNDGVAFTQYKCKMTGVTAGTYVINVVVTYDDSDGGGTAEADVTLIVVD